MEKNRSRALQPIRESPHVCKESAELLSYVVKFAEECLYTKLAASAKIESWGVSWIQDDLEFLGERLPRRRGISANYEYRRRVNKTG